MKEEDEEFSLRASTPEKSCAPQTIATKHRCHHLSLSTPRLSCKREVSLTDGISPKVYVPSFICPILRYTDTAACSHTHYPIWGSLCHIQPQMFPLQPLNLCWPTAHSVSCSPLFSSFIPLISHTLKSCKFYWSYQLSFVASFFWPGMIYFWMESQSGTFLSHHLAPTERRKEWAKQWEAS